MKGIFIFLVFFRSKRKSKEKNITSSFLMPLDFYPLPWKRTNVTSIKLRQLILLSKRYYLSYHQILLHLCLKSIPFLMIKPNVICIPKTILFLSIRCYLVLVVRENQNLSVYLSPEF